MNFNPRTHVGCDVGALHQWHHQPFQSTHPRGVRLNPVIYNAIALGFQSTHPRGVRRTRSTADGMTRNFNPRTHVGCDGTGSGNQPTGILFQSTHPRGVRRRLRACLMPSETFQSTHPRGVRLRKFIRTCITFVFQSTHPRGVRL